ncbi:hypothetical protein MtrunA17_Chr3g0121281 [Medicago truncatula]|uniref:Transmembrane protein n=1 Tax=Medicago truncatula TaxID=3880 RepID=A0A396IUM5_MEDTR|nr:hypothetical protein MtrunA17_Chr3g0121281 [Medicago truncatula]
MHLHNLYCSCDLPFLYVVCLCVIIELVFTEDALQLDPVSSSSFFFFFFFVNSLRLAFASCFYLQNE